MTYTEMQVPRTVMMATIVCDGPLCGKPCPGPYAVGEGWWVVEHASVDTLHFCSTPCALRWFGTAREAAEVTR